MPENALSAVMGRAPITARLRRLTANLVSTAAMAATLLAGPANAQTIPSTIGTPTPNYNVITSELGANVDQDALNTVITTIAESAFLTEDQKNAAIRAAVDNATNIPGAACQDQLDPIINAFSITSDALGVAGDIGEAIGAAALISDFEIPGIVIQTVGDSFALAADITGSVQMTMPNCNAQFTGTVLANANIVANQGISAFNGAINLGNADGITYQGGIAVGGGSISGAGLAGHEARTESASAIAIGNDAVATSDNTVALGEFSSATGLNATGIGAGVDASGNDSTAVGYRASAIPAGSTAVGANSDATGDNSVAMGAQAIASGDGAIALGSGAHATANGSVAIGEGSIANEANTVSVGNVTTQRRITNLAAGIAPTDAVNVSQLQDVQAAGDAQFALTNQTIALLDARVVTNTTNITSLIDGTLGQVRVDNTNNAAPPQASGPNSLAIGPGATATEAASIAIGNLAVATGPSTTVLGNSASATAPNSTVIGTTASSTAANSTVIGTNASAVAPNSTVIGYLAESTGPNSIVIGANSTDGGLANVVSVGTENDTRRVINVSDAVNPHDAVNLNQLVNASAQTLLAANTFTNQRITEVRIALNRVERDANAATASALAVAAIPQTFVAGKGIVGVGTGIWDGETAFAIGASKATSDGKFIFKLGAAYNSRGNVGGSAGAGISW